MTGFLPKRAMGLLALGVSLIAGSASARDLTVVAWGGSSQAAQREVYYRPFTEQTRVPLLEDSWSGGLGILRTRVQAGNPTWDVVQVESDELQLGCDEGLYERIDWAALGGRDAFMPEAVSDCGVGAVVWSVGLTYDGSRLRDAPASWADFWNTQRFPGQRTLRRGPKYTLEIALMSDGVPQSEVYRVLRTPAGVDRAFRRLDQLRPNIVWWTAGAQPGQLLASGEVVMAAAYTSRMFAARRDDRRDFRVVWNGSVYAVDHWVVLRGSQNRDNAMRFVQFATRPENQSRFPTLAMQGVTNLRAARQVDPAVATSLPTHPDNLAVAVSLDVEFWVDNIEELTQRFNAWAAR
ncbi:ABC transporter substrate-binding protein [Siccirubricoccus deserti]|uniref:Polyamine ABC transporter substrate-binding protein n=1 Tax=Siccirubricoccus deserti TaxID=2013562 RepID=A0A9X0UHL0_9PROT|nr:ABC transporter substrate-binding protein [Siccirubricoccus deserti]MBC4016300.1 polyamine ABC transporter substrate-binding protein [Siccirubricoccus deserti]GGC46851.1 ABC transporter substrate-binding protein [Siccirubricoccus deserti]